MKILHIINALERAAGSSLFCVELCRHMRQDGAEARIVCRGEVAYPAGDVPVDRVRTVASIAYRPDIVHIHGLWDFFMHQGMRWCRQRGLPYVVSLHGCLMPYAMRRGWWRKRLALCLYMGRDLRQARLLHVTSESERVECGIWLPGIPSAVVPVGIEFPFPQPRREHRPRRALFLSRVSPEKGLLNLLRAWAQVSSEGWELVIAGPDWRGHAAAVSSLAKELRLTNVRQVGPVYAANKDALYDASDLFVLPSLTENFAVVVAEALAHGLPVITTTGTPWRMLADEECGWWCGPDVESLRSTLTAALAISDREREERGARGISLARRLCDWDVIARAMRAHYQACLTT